MIICSCAVISDQDIRNAIDWMRVSDPKSVITPGKLYRALGKRPNCGGCLSLIVETMEVEVSSHPLPPALRRLRRPVHPSTVLAAE